MEDADSFVSRLDILSGWLPTEEWFIEGYETDK